jgi:hypothetical protein
MTKIVNRVKPLHAARSGQLPDLGSSETADRGALGRAVLVLTHPALSLGEPVREHRRDDLRKTHAETPTQGNQGRGPRLAEQGLRRLGRGLDDVEEGRGAGARRLGGEVHADQSPMTMPVQRDFSMPSRLVVGPTL